MGIVSGKSFFVLRPYGSNYPIRKKRGSIMKRLVSFVCVALLASAAIFAAPFGEGAKLYVSVKSAELKNSDSKFAKTIANVKYGDSVIVLESSEKVSKVQLATNKSVTGWVSNGSLTTKKITKSTGTSSKASSSEIALAGKGFSEEAESSFKTSNKKLNYSAVDAVESIKVSNVALKNFIDEGHLNGDSK